MKARSGNRHACRNRPATRAALVLAALAAFPLAAQAHLVNTGFGPFYDGISHLLLSPEDLLGVVGLALLGGLGGARFGRVALFTLPLAWMGGGLAGLIVGQPASAPVAIASCLLVLGGLVALDRPLPKAFMVAISALFGLTAGFLNGAAAAQGQLGIMGLAGIGATVFVMVALLSAFIVSLSKRPPWTRVVVRVAGSWIAAIGLLMAGWALR